MARRTRKVMLDEDHRRRIQTTQLLKRLSRFALSQYGTEQEKEEAKKYFMSPSQVTAALGVLKKSLPDLHAVEHSGEVNTRDINQLSDAELAEIAARAAEKQGEKGPKQVH